MADPGGCLVRQVEMGLGSKIAKHWRAAGRMLALVAAIVVAIGVHPPHAEANESNAHRHGTDHKQNGSPGHLGFSCLQSELDETQSPNMGGLPPSHADCTQAFDPLLQLPLATAPIAVLVSVATPGDSSFRQYFTSFEPPPPRHV